MLLRIMLLAEKRIAIVVRSLSLGGAERQAAALANGLVEKYSGDVRVWSFEPGHGVPEILNSAIPIRVMHPGRSAWRVIRLAQLFRFTMALRRERPSILIPFTDYPNKASGAVWPATGARLCVWNQRDEGREITRSPLERRALQQASWFVANSGAGRLHLENAFSIPADRITVIANGVELPDPVTERQEWRRRLDIPEGTPIAVMVANLHRFKDHATLLRAWARVSSQLDSDPVLLLAGEPGDAAVDIKTLHSELDLGDTVRLLGRVDDIAGLLDAADLAIHSSRREGCPNGVLEAMAAGLPIVATDIIGIREALGASHPGLVAPGDEEALASKVVDLLDSAEVAHTQGEANRLRADSKFSCDAMTDAWAQLLVDLLEQPS